MMEVNINATRAQSTECSVATAQYPLEYSVADPRSETGLGNTFIAHNMTHQMNPSDKQDVAQTEKADVAATADAPFVAKLVTPAPRSEDLTPAGGGALTAGVDSPTDGGSQTAGGDDSIRVGSPFRKDPPNMRAAPIPVSAPPLSGEAAYGEFGPFRYTTMGASTAAVAVLLFAAIGAWWFPIGGALVAVLGTVLSIVGLFSTKRFRLAAIAMLPLHISLFFLSYARSLA
jgi:hypothetical protein